MVLIADIDVLRHQDEVLGPVAPAHAGVEDPIRHAKDSGLGRFPSREYKINRAWRRAVTMAADPTPWLRLLARPEPLEACEPKGCATGKMHAPARHLAASWRVRRRAHRCHRTGDTGRRL